jgi:hypothetical protein
MLLPAHGLACALALLAFAAGSTLVGTCLSPRAPEALGGTWEEFRARKDEVDVLFLGTSRVFRGIETRIVDEELARAGMELRSCKVAVAGARPLPQDHLLRRILAMEPARLKWILLEIGPLGMTLPDLQGFDEDREPVHARDIPWHTPRQTGMALAAVRRAQLPLGRKLSLALRHLDLLGRNLTNLGALAERFTPSRRERALRRRAPGAPERAALDEFLRERRAVHDAARYRELPRKVSEQNRLPVALDEIDIDFYPEQVRAAAARGIELLHLTMPAAEGSPEAARLQELGILPSLLHFNDPERFPELFRHESRFNEGHLNLQGAERLSRLLAAALLERLRTRPETR